MVAMFWLENKCSSGQMETVEMVVEGQRERERERGIVFLQNSIDSIFAQRSRGKT